MVFGDITQADIFLKQNTGFDTSRDDYLIHTKRSYNAEYKDMIQNIVETLSATDIIATLKPIKHKVAMFMSYQKLHNDNNITNVYKINLIREYLSIQSMHV